MDGLIIGGDHVTEENDFTKIIRKPDGVTVTVEAFRQTTGHSVTVITPLATFLFYPTLAGFDTGFQQNARTVLRLSLLMPQTRSQAWNACRCAPT